MLYTFSCRFIADKHHDGFTLRAENPLDAAEEAARHAADLQYSRIEVWEGPVRVLTWKRPAEARNMERQLKAS